MVRALSVVVAYSKHNNEKFEPVSIDDAKAVAETDLALLVVIDEKKYWIPKSQIKDDSEVYEMGGEGTLVIPRWLAEEKRLA